MRWVVGLVVGLGRSSVGRRGGVPAQQGSGRHQPQLAQRDRQQPAQRAEHGTVEPGECRSGIGAVQDDNLVSQREDLGVFGGIGAGEQRQPAQHASKHQVDESEGHSKVDSPRSSHPPRPGGAVDRCRDAHRRSARRVHSVAGDHGHRPMGRQPLRPTQRHPLRARPARHRPRPLGRFRPAAALGGYPALFVLLAGVAGCGALLAIGSVPRAAGIVDATASTQHGPPGEH